MSLPTKAFCNFIKPQINRGSFFVKYLVCLQEYDDSNAGHEGQFVQYREQNNLTVDQFISLSDVLGGEIETVKRLSGSAFSDYQQHLDYKFRNFGVASGDNIEQSWNDLNDQYSDIKTVLTPSARRVEILKDLSTIFLAHGKVNGSDFSKVSDSQVDKIIAKLNKYEQNILAGIEDEEEFTAYKQVFDAIEEDIESNPTFFLVDTISWIDHNLKNAGESGVVLPQKNQSSITQSTSTDIAEEIANENSNTYLTELTQSNQGPLRKFIADDEGRTLLLDNENTVGEVSFIPRYGLGALAGVWGIAALAGTAPLSVLVGGPIVACGLWNSIKKYENTNVANVSHIYSRDTEAGLVLDFVIQQNGSIIETIEGVSTSDVQITSDPATTVNFGGNDSTLAQARVNGLNAVFDVVSVQGKNYFIASSYASNAALLEQTGIVA